MSKVFGTIAAVLLAVAAFVAFKNKEAKQAELETKARAEKLAKSTTADLEGEQTRLTDATAVRDEKQKETVGVEKELETITARYEEAKKKVDALKSEHASNEKEIANMDDVLKGLPDPKELVPKITRMSNDLTAATSEIATKEATLANLLQTDKNAQSRIAATRKLIDLQSTGKSFPSLRTSISSVYRNWGFVILSAGDSEGVVSGSTLDVIRGGEVIGKLKVTAVEAGRASADIVLDSVAEGTTLQAGDTVVAERETTTASTDQ
ncbi:hypothetical protein JIN77_00415 [Verrucomicrobiaceae bacterium R5-34]|uniref:Uncharacterized protein n=1 Tax=Oceaniferula flava TaxID=2800421 RepID=A0AAE2SAK3_9BACT|nr:hypothetical protein [Oceaniferula flavus]MBK1829175.1 hypothetical protein [Verrucomicrobiaceae bacterium R5-34]MBK1853412.1 hypothetical protein [Oceaniferula flavus]MBM1134717.1 hypothetical protein [Oceaniferula flavus]